MSRSKWKIPHTGTDLLLIDPKQIKMIKTLSRSTIISKNYIDLTFYVYNGLQFSKFIITKEMVGHKLGEYSITRKKLKRKN